MMCMTYLPLSAARGEEMRVKISLRGERGIRARQSRGEPLRLWTARR
jgi:hypothetical protein